MTDTDGVGSDTPRYKYRIETYSRHNPLVDVINEAGKDGWRFVGTCEGRRVVLEKEVRDAE